MLCLFNDLESFSEIDLGSSGVNRYSEDDSTEILLWSYLLVDLDNPMPLAVARKCVRQWCPAEGEAMPDDLKRYMEDPKIIKSAWNAGFERVMLKNVVGIKTPYKAWVCSMVMAMTLSLPGALSKASKILGVQEEYQKYAGKSLINFFCAPRKPTKTKRHVRNTPQHDPKKWSEFKDYNIQDTITEYACWRRMHKYNLPDHEWDYWRMDQFINDTGWPINMKAVESAITVMNKEKDKILKELTIITGLDNPNSQQQLLPWLQEEGYVFEDLKKGHVRRSYEEEDLSKHITRKGLRVLELRLQIAKTSVTKYPAIFKSTNADGFLRGTLQFAGAQRTWRWAGKIAQFHNLAKPEKEFENKLHTLVSEIEHTPELIDLFYDKPMEVLSSCIRPMVQAPKGKKLIVADLNAIETRVVAWLTNCIGLLDIFRNGLDPYVSFGTHLFGMTYDEIMAEVKAGNKKKRTDSKPGMLGCCYMLGEGKEFENEKTGEIEATGLLGYALNMGVKMTQEESAHSVKVYRESYKEVVSYWWEIDRAAKDCVKKGIATKAGPIGFDLAGPFLRMKLPTGRCLYYLRPEIRMKKTPWGAVKPNLTYEGIDSKNKKWTRISTHPGKLVENAVQAIARDILANGLMETLKKGILVCGHVHDEIICLVDENSAEEKLQQLIDSMTSRLPALADLPLGAEGYIDTIYRKD